MQRMSRRAWLRWCALAAAAASRASRAECEGTAPPAYDAARHAIAFLDDRERPQGGRIEELRQRLAAQGLGEERARVETIALGPAQEALGCGLEAARALKPIAFCTASAPVARAAIGLAGDVPLVFTLHGDPVALGIVDRLGVRRTNATGFTFHTPVSPDWKAFEVIAEAFPGTRRVLVVADPEWTGDPGRGAQLARVRQRLGLEVTAAASPRQPMSELQRLAAAGPVAAYLPSGDLPLPGAPELLAALQRQRVPHLAADERLLRHGAMLVLAPRRFAHWDAVAAMLRAIAAGVPARELAVQWPMERLLSLSLAPWQRMGFVPGARLLRRAHLVI